MFIYNVTIQVDWSIHEAWLQWMTDVHIPEVMNTNCFTKYQFVRLLETDEAEGATYAVQYYAESKANYNRYIELYAPALQEKGNELWNDKWFAFRSLMQLVH
jgi:Domain of unknown function (DUF4286)